MEGDAEIESNEDWFIRKLSEQFYFVSLHSLETRREAQKSYFLRPH